MATETTTSDTASLPALGNHQPPINSLSPQDPNSEWEMIEEENENPAANRVVIVSTRSKNDILRRHPRSATIGEDAVDPAIVVAALATGVRGTLDSFPTSNPNRLRTLRRYASAPDLLVGDNAQHEVIVDDKADNEDKSESEEDAEFIDTEQVEDEESFEVLSDKNQEAMDEDDEDIEDSTNNDEEEEEESTLVSSTEQQHHPPETLVLQKRKRATTLVTDYTTPIVEREVPECYYLAIQWGDRMIVKELPLANGPPPSKFSKYGTKYQIIYSELLSRKGKGPVEDGMGTEYYKSYYLGVSGCGIENMDLKTALLRIGDFESLTYEHGAHKTVSRLKLLVSPCRRPPGGSRAFCMRRLNEDQVELIEDNGNLGCGFIPKSLLVEVLGKSGSVQRVSEVAKRVFAIQVRIIGPASVGVCKGMLFVKDGIDKIQVPSSMIKVKQSKTEPLHDDIVLNVHQCFPSKSHELMGRLMNDDLQDPTPMQKENIKAPSDDVLRVLHCKGVDKVVLQQYKEDFKQQIRFNHASLVGVIDPTGLIPSGHVLITGMCNKTPSRVFLTRIPCTEGRDGMVVEVASMRDMPEDAIEFFASLGFGAVVFPLGDELPTKINDGDLDGDNYFCIWDEEVLEGITVYHDLDACDSEILSDDVVGINFQYEIDEISYNAVVVQKLQENPDTYLVETGAKTQIKLTREQIFEGTVCISEVIGHRSEWKGKKLKGIEFNCIWASGENDWESTESIRSDHSAPPQALLEYVQSTGLFKTGSLPKKFCKWLKDNLFEADIVKITDHKTVGGEIKVWCHYIDGDGGWVPIEEAKEDCKIVLGAYAKEKNLFGQPGWGKTDGYWLEEVHDVMCK